MSRLPSRSRLKASPSGCSCCDRPHTSGGRRHCVTSRSATHEMGSALLALYPVGRLSEEAALVRHYPARLGGGVTLGVNIATTGAVDEAFETALGAGVTSVARPVQREWGGYSGYIAEPEGNRWEITWAPCAWRRIPRA
jgi:hypothetical protein